VRETACSSQWDDARRWERSRDVAALRTGGTRCASRYAGHDLSGIEHWVRSYMWPSLAATRPFQQLRQSWVKIACRGPASSTEEAHPRAASRGTDAERGRFPSDLLQVCSASVRCPNAARGMNWRQQRQTRKLLGDGIPYVWPLRHACPVLHDKWDASRINAVVFKPLARAKIGVGDRIGVTHHPALSACASRSCRSRPQPTSVPCAACLRTTLAHRPISPPS
jgi:hypothetical protein